MTAHKGAGLHTYRPGPEGSPLGKDRLPGMNSLLRPPTFIVAIPSSSPATICSTSPVTFYRPDCKKRMFQQQR